MLILRDNTKYSSTSDNLEKYLSLQNIANRNISELLDDVFTTDYYSIFYR